MKFTSDKEVLETMIGEECSDNFSPTLRSRLIKVNKNTCTLCIVPNPYFPKHNNSEKAMAAIGTTKLEPLWLVANMFFGV